MSFNLDRLLNLAQKTGLGLIVYDKIDGRHFTIIGIDEYERLLEMDIDSEDFSEDDFLSENNDADSARDERLDSEYDDIGDLSERELIDKINNDIALWRSRQEEYDFENMSEQLEEEMGTDDFDPFFEEHNKNEDWHSAGEIINKYKKSGEEDIGNTINFLDKKEPDLDGAIKNVPFEDHGEVEPNMAERIDGEDPIFFEEPVQ